MLLPIVAFVAALETTFETEANGMAGSLDGRK